MNRIFSVKEAARILDLSTNTTYKYLNEGKIQAARGHQRGTFRIPAKSLETFLGAKLSDEDLVRLNPPLLTEPTTNPDPQPKPTEAIIHVTPPTFANRVARVLLIASLILIIIDLLLNHNFSLSNQITRLSLVSVLLLLTYQFGGFVKK